MGFTGQELPPTGILLPSLLWHLASHPHFLAYSFSLARDIKCPLCSYFRAGRFMGFFIYLVKLTDPSVCGLTDVNSRSSCWVRAFCGQLWAKGEVEKREGPEAVSWESGCSPTCSQNSSKKALQICHLPSGFGSSCKGHSLLSLFLWIPGHPEQSTVMCEEDGLVN